MTLYPNRISGSLKTSFSTKKLDLPIEKIDSILIQSTFGDRLYGGQTIFIRSSTGKITFSMVQNANDFVKKTIEQIDYYKSNHQSSRADSLQSKDNQTISEKIKDLKELLDSGLISQEEFDQKRQELLTKM